MKNCIICNEKKEVSNFYKHKMMSDGHINKCKDCCKKQSNERYFEKIKSIEFLNLERNRNREKYHRLNYKEKNKPTADVSKKAANNYRSKYPEKLAATRKSQTMPRTIGNHLHHWSYRIEHQKDIIELDKTNHYLIHRFIIYDQERMMYRRIDTNELLSTKESHLEYINQIIKQQN